MESENGDHQTLARGRGIPNFDLSKFKSGQILDVVVSWIVDHTEFYCQRLIDRDEINHQHVIMNKYCTAENWDEVKKQPGMPDEPPVSLPRYEVALASVEVSEARERVYCLSNFEDGNWYRAEIIKRLTASKVQVHYIDFGNLSMQTLADLVRIPSEFCLKPAYAIKVQSDSPVPPQVPMDFIRRNMEGADLVLYVNNTERLFSRMPILKAAVYQLFEGKEEYSYSKVLSEGYDFFHGNNPEDPPDLDRAMPSDPGDQSNKNIKKEKRGNKKIKTKEH